MADFGKTGSRDAKIFHGSVTVNAQAGHVLDYRLNVKGGRPLFTYTCAHRAITSADQFSGHPKANYSWTLFKTNSKPGPTDFVGDVFPTDVFQVGMSFLGATEYELIIEMHDNTGTNIKTVQHIVYKSQSPDDSILEALVVTWS